MPYMFAHTIIIVGWLSYGLICVCMAVLGMVGCCVGCCIGLQVACLACCVRCQREKLRKARAEEYTTGYSESRTVNVISPEY